MIYKILKVRIRSFYENFVNEGDLNFTITVSYEVPIILTSITLGGITNFGRDLFKKFDAVISSFVLKIILSGGGWCARLIKLERGGGSRHTRF